jgi:hypothetical protein
MNESIEIGADAGAVPDGLLDGNRSQCRPLPELVPEVSPTYRSQHVNHHPGQHKPLDAGIGKSICIRHPWE